VADVSQELLDLDVVVGFGLLELCHGLLEELVLEATCHRLFHGHLTLFHDVLVAINDFGKLVLELINIPVSISTTYKGLLPRLSLSRHLPRLPPGLPSLELLL